MAMEKVFFFYIIVVSLLKTIMLFIMMCVAQYIPYGTLSLLYAILTAEYMRCLFDIIPQDYIYGTVMIIATSECYSGFTMVIILTIVALYFYLWLRLDLFYKYLRIISKVNNIPEYYDSVLPIHFHILYLLENGANTNRASRIFGYM